MMRNPRGLIRNLLYAAILVFGPAGTVNALTVELDVSTATAIRDLWVGDTLYNVKFVRDTPENLYGVFPDVEFPFDLGESGIANDAVLNALDSSGAAFVGPSTNDHESSYLFAFFAEETGRDEILTFLNRAGIFQSTNWANDIRTSRNDLENIYAEFTVVPVPAAVWLFGTAVLGLAGVTVRRTK